MVLTGENRSIGIKLCPSATSSTTHLIRTGLGSNPDICGEKPVTSRLYHGTKSRRGCYWIQDRWNITQSGFVHDDRRFGQDVSIFRFPGSPRPMDIKSFPVWFEYVSYVVHRNNYQDSHTGTARIIIVGEAFFPAKQCVRIQTLNNESQTEFTGKSDNDQTFARCISLGSTRLQWQTSLVLILYSLYGFLKDEQLVLAAPRGCFIQFYAIRNYFAINGVTQPHISRLKPGHI